MPEVLAVIPARGGSKGIERKNLREVAGVSLVARAVAAARASRRVTRVIGSTDDPEIADAMVAAGADVPFLRPVELAADDTPDAPVFLHVLRELAAGGYHPDTVVNVRPTAPLRTGADIDAALELLDRHPRCNSVKSVTTANEHPYKMWTLDGELLEPVVPEWHRQFGGDVDIARQRLPKVYRSNGAVDAVRCEALLATGFFHPGPVAAYVMETHRSVDVDTVRDLELAEDRLREEAT